MNSVRGLISFNDRWLRLIAIPIIGFMVPILFFGKSLDGGLRQYLPDWILSMVYTVIYYEGSLFFFVRVHRRFPLLSQTRQRIGWLAACTITYVIIVVTFVEPVVHRIFREGALDRSFSTLLFTYIAILIPAIFGLAIYESFYYFSRLRIALWEAEQLKQENTLSQLETLKNQVKPHFLFNSLNTLASIIPDDAELAVEFVLKLSKVYRYILEIRDLETVSLREELVSMKAYSFMLQIRFGDNLNIRINLPDERMNERVVPLALQILLENAVKHNIVSSQKPLHIDLFLANDNIIMRNNLQRKNQPTDSTGFGLQNIQNRYQLLADRPVNVIVTTQTFAVSLPLLTAPVHERITD